MHENDRWELVELPAGPQPMPDWCKGLEVIWMDGYANSPSFAAKVTSNDVGRWHGQIWHRTNTGLYYTRHDDGRAKFLSHEGALRPVTLQRQKRDRDGNLMREPCQHGDWMAPVMEDYVAVATSQQQGFAGSHVPITMGSGPHEGREVILRGPWYGAKLPGYVELTCVGPDLIGGVHGEFWRRRGVPWHKRGGSFGVCVSEDLLLRLFARYQPHLRMARVWRHRWNDGALSSVRLQPLKPWWDAPKDWMMADGREPGMGGTPPVQTGHAA